MWIGPGVEQCRDAPARPPPPDRPHQRRTAIGQWRGAGGLVRIAAVLEQQFERRDVLAVEHFVHRVGARDPRAVREQDACRHEAFEGVIQRLIVVGVGAGLEQQIGQLEIVVAPGGAIQRRQRILIVGLLERTRRPAAADVLIGIGAGLQQQARAAMQARAKFRDLQQAGMCHGDQRRQLQQSARPVHPTRIVRGSLPHPIFVTDGAGKIGIVSGEIGILGEHPRRNARIGAIGGAVDVAGVDQLQPASHPIVLAFAERQLRLDIAPQVGP
ncbi:hypothetical protein [Bradyrhizobium ivorense]|uniref:hypothetical protein n=1 Tax=Bradyrhizobium ivorense TaxID=2511166 RepID=UPI001E42D01C|nr:hypothetical protein [Bradyrhizobium ivorense]